MTECSDARGRLGVYLLGGLEPAESAELLAHLAECPECAASRERLSRVVELIDVAGPAEAPRPPEGLEERLVARATASGPPSRPRRRLRVPPLRTRALALSAASTLLGAAAAVAILAAAGDLGGGTQPPAHVAAVQLVPSGGASGAKAVVYVITRDGRTTLALEASGLPHPARGQQLIVWCSGRKGSYSAGTIRVNRTGWASAVLNSPRPRWPVSSIEISVVPTGTGVKGYRTIVRGTL